MKLGLKSVPGSSSGRSIYKFGLNEEREAVDERAVGASRFD